MTPNSLATLKESITSSHLSAEIRASIAVSLAMYFYSGRAFLDEYRSRNKDAYFEQYPDLRDNYLTIEDVQIRALRCGILGMVGELADAIYSAEDLDVLASLLQVLINGWAAQTNSADRRSVLRSVRVHVQRLGLKLLTSFDPTLNEKGEMLLNELASGVNESEKVEIIKLLTSHIRAEAMKVGQDNSLQHLDDIPF